MSRTGTSGVADCLVHFRVCARVLRRIQERDDLIDFLRISRYPARNNFCSFVGDIRPHAVYSMWQTLTLIQTIQKNRIQLIQGTAERTRDS